MEVRPDDSKGKTLPAKELDFKHIHGNFEYRDLILISNNVKTSINFF